MASAASSFPLSASRPSTSSSPPCIWPEEKHHVERNSPRHHSAGRTHADHRSRLSPCHGLDPDGSPEGALIQVPRVAKARNMPEDRVRQLVTEKTQGRLAGLLGEPRVNVLALNLALDAAASK